MSKQNIMNTQVLEDKTLDTYVYNY